MKITYLDLLNAAIFVVVMIGICAAGYGLYGKPFAPVTVGLSVFVLAVWGFVGARLKKPAADARTIWVQPVSDAVGRAIINVVMAVWLTFVLAVFVVFVVVSKSVKVGCIAIVLTLVVAYLGGKHGRALPHKSLLPYGVAALGALLVFLTAIVVTH